MTIYLEINNSVTIDFQFGKIVKYLYIEHLQPRYGFSSNLYLYKTKDIKNRFRTQLSKKYCYFNYSVNQ